MRVALCLHGQIGNQKGKSYDSPSGSQSVLDISSKNTLEKLVTGNVDVFLHSWNSNFSKELIEQYTPALHKIEPQIEFEVPPYIKSSHDRAFAHLSRWYSYQQSVALKSSYEDLHNFKYDLVMCQRFDVYWEHPIDYTSFNPKKFYLGNCTLNPNREWSDIWFLANSEDMDKFATLYDSIYTYMEPGGKFTSEKQYAGISSHFLTRFHAKQLKLSEEFKYTINHDYHVTRHKFFEK